MTDAWLTDDVKRAVMAHMNGDHAEDNVVICRAAGGRPDVTAATMTGLDTEGIEFTVEGDGDPLVRIEFSEPVTERSQIREQVARMYHESAAALGLPPREH